MSTQTLVREDWNDISKLTFRNATSCKIIEVKVIESFIGVKPYPVIVVMDTPAIGIVAKQYTLEGEQENKAVNFQIVKVPEPNYEEIVKQLTIRRVFVSISKVGWAAIEGVSCHNRVFQFFGKWYNIEEIENFSFSFDLENSYDFKTYLTLKDKQ